MRSLTAIEELRLKVLTKNSVELTLIEPTETGLKKSIMDATGIVRNYLKEKSVHDYSVQNQGPQDKVIIEGSFIGEFKLISSKVSLYRPNTKKGDPRIWFSGLGKYANANDILALVWYSDLLYIMNLSQLPIEDLINSSVVNPLKDVVEDIQRDELSISNELLVMLRKVAQKPVLSMVDADTSVGRTLETALGIDINSSKKPDYKGIELKSFREKRGNRKTLFAQVPDWKLSQFKSSAEILDEFGYWREEDFKLYCTVSAINRNSQGLSLKVNSDINHLIENSDKPKVGDFVVWELEQLHSRLLEKHKETFWVSAESKFEDGKEYFQYKEVEHTKKPIVSQFDILLEQGVITLDHLIKRNSKDKVVEKGPLFKIKPNSLDLLFPPSEKHMLI
ncbi:hypothetical protein AWW67_05595 [Roseivirga seohaensis]|uniref:MvaI/BcnI restriction endonuclease domain-containing protein n=1 Tax=Roseivirga seohaensis TaxID=1914963 RepID=A0A150XVW0_9BACT|nr:MvaI/BcnI family restriction endonuclease [Roseivirga seohaensis]KYG82901.1 hypothetical protein AWW67_05595 [Roseivirga seohaensis]